MGPVVDAETGFQYLRARYYDPATGQFLTRDPLEAQTRSAYGYVGGNPLNRTDPSGLLFGIDTLAGAALGAVAGAGGALLSGVVNGHVSLGDVAIGAASGALGGAAATICGITCGSALGSAVNDAAVQYVHKGKVDPGQVMFSAAFGAATGAATRGWMNREFARGAADPLMQDLSETFVGMFASGLDPAAWLAKEFRTPAGASTILGGARGGLPTC